MLEFLALIDSPDDRDRFENIYYCHIKRCCKIAYDILGNKSDAEDAVHDAFFALAENIDKVKDADDPATKAYLRIAVQTHSYDILRKKKHNRTEELTEDISEEISDSVLTELCNRETFGSIVEVIREMDESYKMILYLYFVEELSLKEITKKLSLKYSTVNGRLQRGKKILAERVKKELKI